MKSATFLQKIQIGKTKGRVIYDTFNLKCFFESKKVKHYYIDQMWFIIFIAYAAATALVRLPAICLHDSTNTISAPRNVKTDVTDHLSENSDQKIDFAKPKILGTVRNRTKLFILKTLSIDKLKPDIDVDQSSITLYLFNTWYCIFLFFSFSAQR